MVVKDKIGRKRYVVFKIHSDVNITKRDLVHALNNLRRSYNDHGGQKRCKGQNGQNGYEGKQSMTPKLTRWPWIIIVKNNFGLIQCHHKDKNRIIDILQSDILLDNNNQQLNIKTLGTTGTIRSARKKYLDKLILYPLKKVNSK